MPIRYNRPGQPPPAEPLPTEPARGPVKMRLASAPEPSGPSGTTLAVGGLTALLGLSPKARAIAGGGLKLANSLRQQLMLSGFALPKSLLGNVGAAVEASLERGTTNPLRQLFSGETLKDVGRAWKAGGEVGPTPGVLSKIPSPGKAMGSADVATRNALQRAGLSEEEAASAVLQSPIEGRLGQVLESPVARFVHPFRRTPFNQFIEGWGKVKNWRQAPKTMATYTGAGAIHGAATADEDYPLSVPLAIAGSARYGLPYGLAAAAGRAAMGARTGGGIAGSVLPVSEYGVEEATSPEGITKPFIEPAALRALRRIIYGE